MLTVPLLERFEETLRGAGAGAVVDALASGVSDASRFEAASQGIGVALSSEAQVWWSWHDGAKAQIAGRDLEIVPGARILSLEQSIGLRGGRRETAEREAARSSARLSDPDVWWHRCWLPLLATHSAWDVVSIDCDEMQDGAPIRWTDWGEVGSKDYSTPIAPSLESTVRPLDCRARGGPVPIRQRNRAVEPRRLSGSLRWFTNV